MAQLFRVIVPVADLAGEESFYASDPSGLCFVRRGTVFTGAEGAAS